MRTGDASDPTSEGTTDMATKKLATPSETGKLRRGAAAPTPRNYAIAFGYAQEMEQEVIGLLRNGWVLYGSPTPYDDGMLAQAMVKYDAK